MTNLRIDPKTRRLIVSDLTPPIRGRLSSLSTSVANHTATLDDQDTLNFITGKVIKSILTSLWQGIDWEDTDLWDIDWEEWIKYAVMESHYEANSILTSNESESPKALTIPEQTVVGRITDGIIAALTATQVRTLLNVEDSAASLATVASSIVCNNNTVVCNNNEVVYI